MLTPLFGNHTPQEKGTDFVSELRFDIEKRSSLSTYLYRTTPRKVKSRFQIQHKYVDLSSSLCLIYVYLISLLKDLQSAFDKKYGYTSKSHRILSDSTGLFMVQMQTMSHDFLVTCSMLESTSNPTFLHRNQRLGEQPRYICFTPNE